MTNPADKAIKKKISMADIKANAKVRYQKEHGESFETGAKRISKAVKGYKGKRPSGTAQHQREHQSRTGRGYNE